MSYYHETTSGPEGKRANDDEVAQGKAIFNRAQQRFGISLADAMEMGAAATARLSRAAHHLQARDNATDPRGQFYHHVKAAAFVAGATLAATGKKIGDINKSIGAVATD
jgi:hypothetical protein